MSEWIKVNSPCISLERKTERFFEMIGGIQLGRPSANVEQWIKDVTPDSGAWDFSLTDIQSTSFTLTVPGTNPVNAMKFGEDDNTLIFCGNDGVFRKYKMTDGELSTATLVQTSVATGLKDFGFSSDGKTLIGCPAEIRYLFGNGSIKFGYLTKPIRLQNPFDLSELQTVEMTEETLVPLPRCQQDNVTIFQMTDAGLVTDAGSSIQFWAFTDHCDTTTMSQRGSFSRQEVVTDSNQYITGAAVSPNGKTLLVQQASNGTIYKTHLGTPFTFSSDGTEFKTEQVNTYRWGSGLLINKAKTKMYTYNASSLNYVRQFNIA